MTPRELLIRNERAKLTATYLNGLAIAIFAVGGLAPIVGAASGTILVAAGALALLTLSCASTSLVLHLAARLTLRSLET